MRQTDEVYVIESPNHTLHDAFFAAGVDSGDYHAVIFLEGPENWAFVIKKNENGAEPFARSSFYFRSLGEARDWLEPQVPYVDGP